MHRLILFRHAKTEARPAGRQDIDRVLVERGRSEAALIGRVLAEADLTPDLVLVSPAARTRETWEYAKPAFPHAIVETRDGLYEATPEEVEAELGDTDHSAGTVMVVGHNPSLQELAINLLIDGGASASDVEKVSAGFPTATAAVFAIDPMGRAALEGLFLARDYRSQGAEG
jgi:phosphohistidine phosphatase